MTLDIGGIWSTIERVGREDRAMLRSNPSAAADAGRGTWGGGRGEGRGPSARPALGVANIPAAKR